MISNPILPGFNPDPSICRVGDDFYIATSTFEWFPGVQIHHSRDLAHWRLAARPLDSRRLLDMRGNPDSGGIWAPCLSHHDGLFWLIFTDVKHLNGAFKDTPNLLTTAPAIEGPWSDPVPLNSSGFDPSLFHDDDGRTWLVNQLWDHRPGRNRFAGIVLQEYDRTARRLTGPIRNIFAGSRLGVTEGPHLHRWHGQYYLVTAEGGTGWNHAVTVARSPSIEGPYEIDPRNPIVTSRDRPGNLLQKAGHASICDAPDGSWWLVHLASRPVGERRCILGRETCLQRLEWTPDRWLRLAGGGSDPRESVDGPDLPAHPWPVEPERLDFTGPDLPSCFQTLREPADASWLSLSERPGHLRLRGRHSPTSRFSQSLIARRLTALRCSATCRIDCVPGDFQQMAGLLAFYDCDAWYYLRVTHLEGRGRVLSLAWCDDGAYGEQAATVEVPAGVAPELGFDLDHERLQFRYDLGAGWQPFGPALDATRLSDDYGKGWNFTGAWAALAAHDLSGRGMPADFAYFAYRTG